MFSHHTNTLITAAYFRRSITQKSSEDPATLLHGSSVALASEVRESAML